MSVFKRHLKYIVVILGSLDCTSLGAQICDFHGKPIALDGQTTPAIFNATTTLEYLDQILMIDGSPQEVEELEVHFFDNRGELDIILGCSFPLAHDFYASVSGEILAFDLNEDHNSNGIQKLDYISFDQYGRKFKFVLINRTYLYEFVNAVTHILQPSTFYEQGVIGPQSFEYIRLSEISGDFTLISEALYETVTEQVLVSDAYSKLIIVPAEFETAYHHYYHESSDCEDAIVETESMNFIAREEYSELQIIEAELATVTELSLDAHAYYGPTYFKREIINLDSLKLIYTTNLVIDSMKEDCYHLNFLRCANYTEVLDSTTSVPELGDAYLPCPTDYSSAGVYCYSQEIEVPATYKQRDYLKLVTPASTISTVVEAEMETVEVSRITNKETIDESCITYAYDSIAYYKLVSPPTVAVTEIPASYGTITRSLLHEPPVFEAIASEEKVDTIIVQTDENILTVEGHLNLQNIDLLCMHETIKRRLVELSLANEEDEIYGKAYYQAIIEYQQSKQIKIGAIDKDLLESLNISFE